MSKSLIMMLMASSVLLSGCGAVGLATGVGAAVGVSAAKEGGIKGTVADEAIRLNISDLWFKKDVKLFSKLNLTVNQGRVLVTGVVQNPEDRVEAIRLAWQPKGVKQVINEVRVGESGSIGTYAQDTWISGQLRTQMTFDENIQSINYSIETVHGSVYLMGVAQSQDELDRVFRLARRIKGVKEVISYVKMSGVPVQPDNAMATTSGGAEGSVSYGEPVPLSSGMETQYINGMNNDGMNNDMAVQPYDPASSSVQSEVLPP